MGAIQMKEFKYGVVYIVERTETSVTAFELISKEKDCITVYVREYTPAINSLIGYVVQLHVSNDEQQEFVNFKNNIPASQYYDGKTSIYTKAGLKTYDEKTHP